MISSSMPQNECQLFGKWFSDSKSAEMKTFLKNLSLDLTKITKKRTDMRKMVYIFKVTNGFTMKILKVINFSTL